MKRSNLSLSIRNQEIEQEFSLINEKYISIPQEEITDRLYDYRDIQNQLEFLGEPPISFYCSKWDISSLKETHNSRQGIVVFPNFEDELFISIRLFALYLWRKGNAPSTIQLRIYGIRLVTRRIFGRESICSFYGLTIEDIERTLNSMKSNYSIENAGQALLQFLSYLDGKLHARPVLDYRKLDNYLKGRRRKYFPHEYRTQIIPFEFANEAEGVSLSIMKDKSMPHNMRLIACMIVIMKETGIRISDFLSLRKELPRVIKHNQCNGAYGLVDIRNNKDTRRKDKYENKARLIINEDTANAIIILEEIRKELIYDSTITDLVIAEDNKGLGQKSEYPRIDAWHKEFYYRYLHGLIVKSWPGITRKQLHGESLSIPSLHQYRATLCTALELANTPIDIIRYILGHKSYKMRGYYCRLLDSTEEKNLFLESTIKGIGNNQTHLIGAHSTELETRIKTFIRANKFNIETDIDSIVKALGEQLVFKPKSGGVCIRSAQLPCKEDPTTDSLMCAAGLCKNLYYLYFHAPITYSNLSAVVKARELNLRQGNIVAVSKMTNKILYLTDKILIPQIVELDKTINIRGEESVLLEHPELLEFVEKLDEVKKNIKLWTGITL